MFNSVISKMDRFLISTRCVLASDLDVESMLSGNGEADGALSGAKEAVDAYGKGIYVILSRFTFFAAAIMLLIFFARMMIHSGNAQKKAEIKDGGAFLLIGAVGGFAVSAILAFLQKIGGQLL